MLENWSVLLGITAVAVVIIIGAISFSKMPREEQIRKIKELLLAWVTEAERDLGSGTGPIKLRFVYDRFALQFPTLFKVISFETFSGWVDEALEQMEALLQDREMGLEDE